MEQTIQGIARALQKLVDEHGRNNSFAPTELAQRGGPAPMLQGQVGRSAVHLRRLNEVLKVAGWEGLSVRYEGSRWRT